MKVKIFCFICLCLCLLGNIVLAEQVQDLARAKIGIKLRSRGRNLRVKAIEERSRAGDRVQIYVMPEPEPAYVYVVSRDQHLVTRLNATQEQTEIAENFLLKLSYTVDELFHIGERKITEGYLTIICSSDELPGIDEILNDQDNAYAKWLEYEQKLEKMQIDLSDPVSKPLNIAGTARDLISSDPFLKKLPIFSGKSIVVKKYEFRIKK